MGTENYEIDRDTEIAEGFTEAHELRAAAFQVGLDDQHFQIAIGATLASGTGSEEDHRGVWCGLRLVASTASELTAG
jgi:hypothetical protein